MYLSHTVRRIREEPQPDETVGLVVELDEDTETGALDALRETVERAGGSLGRDLGFDAHHAVVPESAIDDLTEVDGVVRIETDATISFDATALDSETTDRESTGRETTSRESTDRETTDQDR